MERTKQLWRTIERTIREWDTHVERIKTWVKDEGKKAWKKASPHINRIKKRAESIARGAAKVTRSAGRGLANAARWAGNQMKPGNMGWKFLKVALSVGAFVPICSALCAMGAAAMTVYDMGRAIHDGNPGLAAVEFAGLATFGLGRVIKGGVEMNRAAQAAARAMPRNAPGRVDQLTRANAEIANGTRTLGKLSKLDYGLVAKDSANLGLDFVGKGHWLEPQPLY